MSTILTANFRIADLGEGTRKMFVHLQGREAFATETIDLPEGLHAMDAMAAAMQGTADRIDRIMAEHRAEQAREAAAEAKCCGQCGAYLDSVLTAGRGACTDLFDRHGDRDVYHRVCAWDAACGNFDPKS